MLVLLIWSTVFEWAVKTRKVIEACVYRRYVFIIIEYLSEKRSKLYLIHDLECSIASLLWCFRYFSIDGTSVKDAGMTDRATLNGTNSYNLRLSGNTLLADLSMDGHHSD